MAQIMELEKQRDSLVTTATGREEKLSALQEQLECSQLKLASAQASAGCSLRLT